MCGVWLKDIKSSTDVMFMLGLCVTIVCYAKQFDWYGHVLKRKDGHVLRRALVF